MIARLKGKIDEVFEDYLIIDVNGVGYQVFCSRRTLDDARAKSDICTIEIETIVREDAFLLYGFSTMDEKSNFKLLTSVQGVGARVALAILSSLSPQDIQSAIACQDKAMLTRADGVGPKLASRILNELKDKAFATSLKISTGPNRFTVNEEAVAVLNSLGYGRIEAVNAVQQTMAELGAGQDVQAIIKHSLSKLSKAVA